MKIIFISIAAFVLLLSCSEEKGSNPTQPNAAKNIWDTVSFDTKKTHECNTIWLEGPIIIKDDSTYKFHERNLKQLKPYCDSIPFPTVNFTTYDVIWWSYPYDRYITKPIGILRKNDSLKQYEFISTLSAKYIDLGMFSSRHFHIVPKLLPDYRISFIRDTINKEQ